MPARALLTRGAAPLAGAFTLNRNSPQAAGLLDWWPTRQNPAWGDQQGRAPATVFNGGVAVIAAPERPGLACDGAVGSYAQINYAPAFGSADFTISLWFYKRAATSGFSNLWGVNRWNTGGTAGTNEWSLGIGNGNTGTDDKCNITVEVGSVTTELDTTTAPALNTWHLLTGVRRNNTLELYVDGVSAATPLAVSGSVNVVPARSMRLANSGLNNFYTNAVFDDCRIYLRALSPAEIWQLYDPATRWELYLPQRLRHWLDIPAPIVPPATQPVQGLRGRSYTWQRG